MRISISNKLAPSPQDQQAKVAGTHRNPGEIGSRTERGPAAALHGPISARGCRDREAWGLGIERLSSQ